MLLNNIIIQSNYFLFKISKIKKILWCQSWFFCIITPVFSVTQSFRNHLICWFGAQETFIIIIIIIKVENCFSALYFSGNNDTYFSRII